jgi:type IV pilus assembly protein PilW
MTAHKQGRRRPPSTRPLRQAGFTLIELLISMLLGMVVIGALVVMYVSGSAATRNTMAQGQMNEDAQMALAVITQELRQAGYNPTRAGGLQNDLLQGGWSLFACDTGFNNPDATTVGTLICSGAGASSALAVVFEGDLATGKNTAGGLPMDCIGNGVAVAGGGSYYVMQSRLYIANNALNCRGSGNLAQSQVLAENIESLSVLFAVTQPAVPNSQVVLGYLGASGINTPTDAGLAALSVLNRWNKVAAARVCVVVVSEDRVLGDMRVAGANPSYQGCDGSSVDITDGRLRRAYRTTVLLRNHGVGYAS